MAKYEKRQGKKVKLNKISSAGRPKEQPERIAMSRNEKHPPAIQKKKIKESSFHVLRGQKPKKSSVFLSVVALILLFLTVFQLALPTGIIEFLQNSYALQVTSGNGSDSLMGTAFLQANGRYGRIDLLSGAYYEVYNKNGGTSYTVQHGLSSPVMVSSAARTMIFDRDGSDVRVYNLQKQVKHLTVDGKIYTATISRNGKLAVAYKSNDYLSVVDVFSKGGEKVFTHNFKDEYVSAVSLNTSGRFLTVTTLFSKGGVYHSNLYLFHVKKKTQISKTNYENIYFTESQTLSYGSTLIISYDKAIFAFPAKGTISELNISEKISNYAVSANGSVALVCNQADNTINNKIRYYNKRGKLKTELEFTGTIDGFSVSNTHIYILSDSVLHTYSVKDGEHTETALTNAQFLSAFRGGAAVISNAKLKIIKQ